MTSNPHDTMRGGSAVLAALAVSWFAGSALAAEIPMVYARHGHTATLLSDGTVLVAGGFDSQSICRCAELYDPGTHSFRKTGAPAVPRMGHTATLLGDGTVLFAGGSQSSPTAETYDARSRTFTATEEMITPRSAHAAAPLADGRVLLVGGVNFVSPLNVGILQSTEIYDPRTRTFKRSGDLIEPREHLTATTLLDGRVLVAGGYGRYGAVNTAEIFDPIAGTFRKTGSLAAAHAVHTATLLSNGFVLVAGGTFLIDHSAEIFDPNTERWSSISDPLAARNGHAAALLHDGSVVIAGGRSPSLRNDVIRYDTTTRTLTVVGTLEKSRVFDTVTVGGDFVLVSGGCGQNAEVGTAETIDVSHPLGAASNRGE
jgi:Kelch motif/Galactose oxidase, central domain